MQLVTLYKGEGKGLYLQGESARSGIVMDSRFLNLLYREGETSEPMNPLPRTHDHVCPVQTYQKKKKNKLEKGREGLCEEHEKEVKKKKMMKISLN